jgi:hypothetical protein
MDYVQLQQSFSCSDSWCLKLVREIYCKSPASAIFAICSGSRELEGKAAKEVLALGMTSEIYLLKRML